MTSTYQDPRLTEHTQAPSKGPSFMQAKPQNPAKILVVEPHPTLRTVLVQRLRQDGHLTAAVASQPCAYGLVKHPSWQN